MPIEDPTADLRVALNLQRGQIALALLPIAWAWRRDQNGSIASEAMREAVAIDCYEMAETMMKVSERFAK